MSFWENGCHRKSVKPRIQWWNFNVKFTESILLWRDSEWHHRHSAAFAPWKWLGGSHSRPEYRSPPQIAAGIGYLATSCDILWPFMATSCRTGKNLEESTWINISIHFCDWRVMKCRGVLFREAAKHSKLLILADRTASFHSYGLFIFKNFIYLELESKIYVQISILDGCTVKQQVFEAWSYVSFESNGSWLVKSFRFVGPDKLGPATNSSCEKWSCARISGSRISFEDGSGGAQAAI